MAMVTLRWEDANEAAGICFPLAGDDSEALDRELAAAVSDGIVEVRLDVAKHAFFKLQGYAAGLKDNKQWGRVDRAKQGVRKSLREVGYCI